MKKLKETTTKELSVDDATTQVAQKNAGGDGFDSEMQQLIASAWDGVPY